MNLQTPSTLYISLYEASDGTAAATGSLRNLAGRVTADVAEGNGADAWQALRRVLEDVELIRAKHCLVFTNSETVRPLLTDPYVNIPQTPDQWAVIFELVRYQQRGGTWQAAFVDEDKLQKARELHDSSDETPRQREPRRHREGKEEGNEIVQGRLWAA